jgi:hypothetical protein
LLPRIAVPVTSIVTRSLMISRAAQFRIADKPTPRDADRSPARFQRKDAVTAFRSKPLLPSIYARRWGW